jgi:glyoxylase I family protein
MTCAAEPDYARLAAAMDTAPPPFTLKGLDHVLLLVEHMPRALAFYRDVLGCTVANALPQFGMLELTAGASMLDLVDIADPAGAWAKPDAPGGRNMDHLCLALGRCDTADLRRHLAAHGIAITEEREERGSSFSLYVRDPSGNTIELKAPIDTI